MTVLVFALLFAAGLGAVGWMSSRGDGPGVLRQGNVLVQNKITVRLFVGHAIPEKDIPVVLDTHTFPLSDQPDPFPGGCPDDYDWVSETS